jgi:hypothetical protein
MPEKNSSGCPFSGLTGPPASNCRSAGRKQRMFTFLLIDGQAVPIRAVNW